MKTSMERVYPIVKDMQEQFEAASGREYVFFYDDGVFRSFAVDGVDVGVNSVTAWAFGSDPLDHFNLITIPSATTWRLVHKSCLELVNGATMEQLELIGGKQKADLKEKMLKKLGYSKDGKKKGRKEPSVEGIPLATGQYA
jgi:hypothetical protein